MKRVFQIGVQGGLYWREGLQQRCKLFNVYLFKVSQEAIINAGGMASWENLSQNERKTHHDEAFHRFALELGEAEFAKLDDSQKKNIDLLIWAGCCMHKEMNAFKGGCTHMSRWWEENGISGPIKMYNRDNAAAADLGAGTTAAKRAEEHTQGGAIKVSSLAGAVFRHKDRVSKTHFDIFGILRWVLHSVSLIQAIPASNLMLRHVQ